MPSKRAKKRTRYNKVSRPQTITCYRARGLDKCYKEEDGVEGRHGEAEDEGEKEGEETWVRTKFLVVLPLGSTGTAKVQSMLDRREDHASPSYPHSPDVTRVRVRGPQVKEEEEEEEKEHKKTSKQTPRWRDETLPFDMPREYVVASEPGKNGVLGTGTEDADADGNANANVNVNAIFPPGIPLSASEILAFYPQHVIRQDVAERLVRNGYEARDVLGMIEFFHGGRAFGGTATSTSTTAPSTTITTATATNTLHRVFTAALPSSQTAPPHTPNPTTYPLNATPPFPQNPNPDTTTNTNTSPPTVPTLSHLLTSLTHLPTSLAARHLTTSLKWYAANKHTFTPPLDLTVLHTRALVQALRIPLRDCGPQNVDAVVLAAWRAGGGSVVGEKVKLELGGGGGVGRAAGATLGGGARNGGEEGGELEEARKSRAKINVPSGDVEADVVLRVGSVLLMPYFAVGGMVCVALEMGIGKAEGRRRERERGELVKDGSGGAGRVADGGSEGEDEGDGEVGGGRDGDESGVSRVEESRGYVGSRKRARNGEDSEDEEGEEEGA